jgi:hypothetical protein
MALAPGLAKVLIELIINREMAFCKQDFIIIKSNYFQNAQRSECILNDFGALVREICVWG